MLFRIHADTLEGERVNRDVSAGSPKEAESVSRKLWRGEGIYLAKVLKIKVVKAA